MNKEIAHSFHFSCGSEVILSALTENQHIRNWWTQKASVVSGQGTFEWPGYGWRVELKIEASRPDLYVVWKCTESNMQNTNAWEGSEMHFQLISESDGTRLNFRHLRYKNSPCYDVCHDGWSFFLGTSLKNYLETGKGRPYSFNEPLPKATD